MNTIHKPKVLIVDDSPESLHILLEALRDSCAVVVAKNGHQAIELAHRHPRPEVILLDVMMPEPNGYQVCRTLKEEEAFQSIPVLFITSLQDAEEEHLALTLGAVDFIRKPINPSVVKARTLTHVELARARRQLEEQNSQLLETAKMRDLVERILHHDLKGPLSSIIGIPELMMNDINLFSEQKEFLNQIIKSGYTMLEMINRSLDLYKMEAGTYNFQPTAIYLYPILERTVAEKQRLAQIKQCQVLLQLQPGYIDPPWWVPAEELLCLSLFGNLLKNALEASPFHSRITITHSLEKKFSVVRIHNQGVVPEPIREQFFNKFVTHGKPGGTGLGCYSAHLMARVQHADITMETSDKIGTTLTVRFPLWKH